VDALVALADAGFDIAHAFDAAAAAREPGLASLAGDARLAILIGNTRALWPRFSQTLRDAPAGPDPLDRYTERHIAAAFPDARIYYAHRRYDGAFLPLQRLAVATGLGALAPSQLVIHPIYGPWFALRAVVVPAHGAEPPPRAPIAQPCRCDASCGAALAHAQRSTDWRDWLSVRDSCSLRGWRYTDEQIRFHYLTAWPGPG
jgi:methylmalonic aciduria homocystinuria type C protein